MGSLSSWYVLSSIGFYPVTPGSTTYAIGSPMFGEVTINTIKGNKLRIKAVNNSETNIYIQSAILNGNLLNYPFFDHKAIMDGGELTFIMGSEPNREWGIAAPPPSLSD
jgi:putative alpha-1,2-mannosidase